MYLLGMLDRNRLSRPQRSLLALSFLALALPALAASPTRLLRGLEVPQDRALTPSTSSFAGFAARSAPRSPDTLEVNAFLVEFLKETPDNGATTGNGTFGSDSSTKTPLESWRARRDSTRQHFLRVFQGVSEYWRTASGGKVEIVFRVFPEAAGAKPYAVPRTMGAYSPIGPAKGEKQSTFDSTYVVRILEMVSDAARKAAADPAGPFSVPKPTSSNRHRAYLMIHAGASRSTDGGEKGSAGANTAADIGDFTVGRYDYKYLADKKRSRDTTLYRKDTSGIALGLPGVDTLTDLLVAAETGSQDGTNWGIRGTVANLVGRALGLPDLYDTYRGLSVMGQFDIMDAAGAFAGRNSVPPLPSAWSRLFLGWSTAIEATPSGTKRFRLPAVRPGHDTVLLMRINDGEYLLVENRQRTKTDGTVSVSFGTLAGTDVSTFSVKPDSLDSLLRDAKRTAGYVLASSPDASLPGSGLLVWHVNEWLLRALVRSGAPNASLGDTLSDRYKGITLVQASGKQTLGRQFVGITGQSSTDIGSGSDMLPHAVRRDKKMDTVTAIGPEGYASTGTLLGARTLATLKAPWPASAAVQAGKTSLEGDSVWTPGAAFLELELDWGGLRGTTDKYPIRTPPAWGEQSLLSGPPSLPRSIWVLDTAGRALLLDSTGASWFAARDTVKSVSPWDSTPTAVPNRSQRDTTDIAWARVGAAMGRPAQSALLSDTLAVRDARGGIHLKWPSADAFQAAHRDSARFADTTWSARLSAGPVVVDNRLWVADSQGNLRTVSPRGASTPLATGLGRIQSLCASSDAARKPLVAVVDTLGTTTLVDATSGATTRLRAETLGRDSGEVFQIVSADFDRDGAADLAVVGSHGNAALWSGKARDAFPGWPQRFPRGASGVGEPGGLALGDLDADGRPDLVFAGTDRVYAVDVSGLPLKGWPVRIAGTESVGQATSSKAYPAGILGSTPLVADLDGNGTFEVVAGSPDGQILAWTAAGKAYAGKALAKTAGSGVAPTYAQASWPLAAGGQILETNRPAYLPVAFLGGKADKLSSLSSLSTLDAFVVPGARAPWAMAQGGAGRSGYLPDSLLGTAKPLAAGIGDFHLFPSPVRGGKATFRYELGKTASRVKLTIYDQTGFQVLSRDDLPAEAGRRELALTGLAWGTGVYAARLESKWADGGSNEAWVRFGVIR